MTAFFPKKGIVQPLGFAGFGASLPVIYSTSSDPANIATLADAWNAARSALASSGESLPTDLAQQLQKINAAMNTALSSYPLYKQFPPGTSSSITVKFGSQNVTLKIQSKGYKTIPPAFLMQLSGLGMVGIPPGTLEFIKPDGSHAQLPMTYQFKPGESLASIVPRLTYYPASKNTPFWKDHNFWRGVVEVAAVAVAFQTLLPSVAAPAAPSAVTASTSQLTTSFYGGSAGLAPTGAAAIAAPSAGLAPTGAAASIVTAPSVPIAQAVQSFLPGLTTTVQTAAELAPAVLPLVSGGGGGGGAPSPTPDQTQVAPVAPEGAAGVPSLLLPIGLGVGMLVLLMMG